MSFVKKAIRKVFKFVKKVVSSKVFKWVAIAAITFFTAGVAAGGFASFATVGNIGQFFTAVGQTIATGAASVASSLGFQGVSSSLAARGGAAAIQAGLTTSATSATGAALSANLLTGGIDATAGGVTTALAKGGEALALSAKGAALAGSEAASLLASNTAFIAEAGLQAGTTGAQLTAAAGTGLGTVTAGLTTTAAGAGVSSNLWKGVQVGFAAMAAAKGSGSKRKGRTFVAGGLSRGGSATIGPQPFFVVGGRREDDVPIGTEPSPSQPSSIREDTLAGILARQNDGVGGVNDIEQGTRFQALPDDTAFADNTIRQPSEGILGLQSQAEDVSVQDQLFGDFVATNIQSPVDNRSLDDRVFNGRLRARGVA